MLSLLDNDTADLFKLLPENNPTLGYILNEGLVNRCLEYIFDKNSTFYKLYKSGSRFSKQQLSRTSINIGYFADECNIVQTSPIKSNLMQGLNEEEFFQSSYGTRKGIADKSNNTPDSGYLERTLTMALGVVEIKEDDCNDDLGLIIQVLDDKHAETLIGKYRILEDKTLLLLTKDMVYKLIGQQITIRSPMTCQSSDFKVCKKCFGEKNLPSKYVGVIAGQILAERTTQLTLRAFHDSGSAKLDVDPQLVNLIRDYLINIRYDDKYIILDFNPDEFFNIPDSIKEIPGFIKITKNKNIYFIDDISTITNVDVVAVLKDLNILLNTKIKPEMTPSEYYENFMRSILTVGSPYSSYVEILFANSFVCDKESTEYWRYNREKKPYKKFGIKSLSKQLSPLLGLLYEPNAKSLENIKNNDLDIFIENLSIEDCNKLNIYERMYLGYFE